MDFDTLWLDCEKCRGRAFAKTKALWNPCERDLNLDEAEELGCYLSFTEIHSMFLDIIEKSFECDRCGYSFIAFPEGEDQDKINLMKELLDGRRRKGKNS